LSARLRSVFAALDSAHDSGQPVHDSLSSASTSAALAAGPILVTRRRRSRLGGAGLVAVIAFFGACTQHRPPQLRPGTGELAFRARCIGASDVDLSVTSPLGEHLAFDAKTAPSGGQHDIDCNYSSAHIDETAGMDGLGRSNGLPAIDRHLCAEPMENVFGPRGRVSELAALPLDLAIEFR
jgi:hypothetical protein